jgi:anti-sigma factor RsiW
MSTERQAVSRPSDEELMCFLDGELDEARSREVATALATDAELRAKLAGLRLGGELLREHVDGDARADGVASAVMTSLEAEANGGAKVVDGRFGAQRSKRRLGSFIRSEPANDNPRGVLLMAALAAAVAVGLFVWSRAGLRDLPVSHGGPDHRVAAPPTALAWQPGASAAEPKWLSPATSEPVVADDQPAAAVQVAAVDFGSHSGTVFYVSTGSTEASTTTAVVWVTDEVAGGRR